MDGGQAGIGGEYGDSGGTYYAGEVKTPFATGEDLESMKAMVVDAKPELVLNVAEEWENIHDLLVHGGGSVKGDFDRTVRNLLQHWEGEAAEAFAREAGKVSKQLGDCGTYARYIATAMRNAGERLSEIKPKIEALGKRRSFGDAVNRIGGAFSRGGGRLDPGFRGDLGERRAPDDGDPGLPAGKDDRSKAVALMVELALTYNSQTQAMNSWQMKLPPGQGGDGGDYPGEPGGVAPVSGPVSLGRRADGAVIVGAAGSGGPVVGRSVPMPEQSGSAANQAAAIRVDGISGGTANAPRPQGGEVPPRSSGITGSGVPGGGVMGGGPAPGSGVGASRGAGGAVPGGLGAGAGAVPGVSAGSGGRAMDAAAGRRPSTPSVPSARQGIGGNLDHIAQRGETGTQQGGRALHFSRGGALAGERGREGDGPLAAGALGRPVRPGGPTKYSRRTDDPYSSRTQDERGVQSERPGHHVEESDN
ncbi:hypothetical protein [Streptomyces marispadix]|uniref:PPE family domain-containing protein n=1 Tax=Streptomyces marispadix TaxID=2922868 RepID=A0ABS9SW99_9ACTN|nr:hypothetical protein [Streptomyces marispadix]MCH6160542.1 hypothetical protein [Streptomyces marispadix]